MVYTEADAGKNKILKLDMSENNCTEQYVFTHVIFDKILTLNEV